MKKNTVLMMGMIAGGCIVIMHPAWAQMQPQTAQQQSAQPQQSQIDGKRKELLDKMKTLQEKANTLQEEISEIARKAQENNPEIKKMHTDLMDIYKKKLSEYGYPSEAEMQKLRDWQKKLQDSDIDESARQQLTQRFNAEVEKLQKAQEKARKNEEVIAKQQVFEQTRSKAMSELNPEAQSLERKLENIQRKREKLRMQFQQVMQATPQ